MTPAPWWARAARRALLLADRPALRPAWTAVHRRAALAAVAVVTRGERGVTAYGVGTLASGEVRPGTSDLDVNVVLAGDPGSPGAQRLRCRRRRMALDARLPRLSELMLDLSVSEQGGVPAVWNSDVLRFGLADEPARPVYSGSDAVFDFSDLLERPRLPTPNATWRRLSGTERLPPAPVRDPQARRIAAWLELQFWWRFAFEGCLDPDGPRKTSLAVKLAAEPLRVLHWLRTEAWAPTRREALLLAPSVLPEHASAAGLALAAHDAPAGRGRLRVDDVLGLLVAATGAVSATFAEAVAEAGTDAVALDGLRAGGPLALADWRGRALAFAPVERLVPLPGDPADAAAVAAAARTGRWAGEHAALRREDVLVLPTTLRAATLLRAVQCPATDPVSFALLDGAPRAAFPRLAGWSLEDCARRAVAEHRGWLRDEIVARRVWLWSRAAGPNPAPAVVLGWLARAVAAALWEESTRTGEPRLIVDPVAALGALAECEPASAAAAAEGAAVLENAERARGEDAAAALDRAAAPVVAALLPHVRALAPYR